MGAMRQVNRFWGATVWRAAASGFGVGYAPLVPGTRGAYPTPNPEAAILKTVTPRKRLTCRMATIKL